MTIAKIDDKGDILINNKQVGVFSGLRFIAKENKDDEISAKEIATEIAPLLEHKADRLLGAPNDEILLTIEGHLRWQGEIIAELIKGEDIYSPKIILLADDNISKQTITKINDRLNLWLRHHINTQFELILALKNPENIDGLALKLCQSLYESFGVLPRQQVLDLVKGLDQEIRGKLRHLGIKFGAFHIYLPLSLKPAPRELALILWALNNDSSSQEGFAELPHIILSGRTSFEINENASKKLYEIAGFKAAGKRAVRIDILERLADIIRPLINLNPETFSGELPDGAAPKNGFRVNVEMTSLLGCAGDDFSSVLLSLGYKVERTKIDKALEKTIAKQEPTKQEPTKQEPTEQENTQDAKETNIAKENKDEKEEILEPIYDEIWHPNYHRSDNKKPYKSNQKPYSNKSNNRPDNRSKNQTKNKKFDNRKPYKSKQKPIDPDSPFAALLALKNKNN